MSTKQSGGRATEALVRKRGQRNAVGFFLGLMMLFGCAGRAAAQESGSAKIQGSEPGASSAAAQTLDNLRALMKRLSERLDTVSEEQKKAEEEASRLRHELEIANERLAALENPSSAGKSATTTTRTKAPETAAENSTTENSSPEPNTNLEQRLSRIEESQELLHEEIGNEYQSKLESSSKYRVRFSGLFLLNFYGNRGAVDNQDFPEIAVSRDPGTSNGAIGGTLRQSQIGIEGFGPDFLGAHTSADLQIDFAGNTTTTQNGALLGTLRLRTGAMRLDWKDTSVIAGQDFLFFAPLTPTSLASIAVPPLSYAGNLWGWAPQVRVEHRFSMTENGKLVVTEGILEPLSGDVPAVGQEIQPTVGTSAEAPAVAAHVAWQEKMESGNFSVGTGGYYGRQNWGFNRTVDSWTSTVDLLVPITKYTSLSGEFYRGRAIGGLGGGAGQSVALAGQLSNAANAVHGLNSEGGWAQLKIKPTQAFQINGALGIDTPFASQLRQFPTVPSEYDEPVTRTRQWFVNFIFQPKSNVVTSLEFRRLTSFGLDPDEYKANQINLSIGYIF